MPGLAKPFTTDQLAFEVVVAADQLMTRALMSLGLPVPTPVRGHAVLDTGANVTAVSPGLLARLGLPVVDRRKTETAAGVVEVNMYRVSVLLPVQDGVPVAILVDESTFVSELSEPLDGVEILFGLDMLRNGRMVLDGPAGTFALEF